VNVEPGALKPRLRGVSHEVACLVSLPLGAGLVVAAGSTRARVALAIYAVSLAALFGVSATYHRVNWRSLRARLWMRRLDHAMIFLLIAGTFTPFGVLVLHGTLAVVLLSLVWFGAAGGIAFNLAWSRAPKWLMAAIYVALGWVGVAALPQLARGVGLAGVILLILGGLLYTSGAVIYTLRRPDPAPTVFGYHEVFHALVIAAAGLQYAVIAFWVI
jgi:hemolysin III